MIYELPLYKNIARWNATFDLSNERFTFHFDYNAECEFWSLYILDANDELICGEIRLVKYIDLLEENRKMFIDVFPKGILRIVPRNNIVKEITKDNLTTDFALLYED